MTRGRQRRSSAVISPRWAAIGSRIKAIGAVRKKMSVDGATSLTAMRIRR
jgi:hypothetical protein